MAPKKTHDKTSARDVALANLADKRAALAAARDAYQALAKTWQIANVAGQRPAFTGQVMPDGGEIAVRARLLKAAELAAEDDARVAEAEAATACDAADVASGDADAAACDLARLRTIEAEYDDKKQELEEALASLDRERNAEWSRASTAATDLAARRASAGMPRPLGLEVTRLRSNTTPENFRASLNGGPKTRRNDGQIDRMRREARSIAARLEAQRLEDEAAAREEAKFLAAEARVRKQEAAQEQAKAEAAAAEARKQSEAQAALANSFLDRLASEG